MNDIDGTESPAPDKTKDVTYKAAFSMEELESLIDTALNELDFGGLVESSLEDLNEKLKSQENDVKEIDKVFKDCENHIQKLQDQMGGDDVNGTAAESDDDDVQVVNVTYEKPSKPNPQEMLMQALRKNSSSLKPGQYYLGADAVLHALQPGQRAPPGTQVVSVKSNESLQKSPRKQDNPVAPSPKLRAIAPSPVIRTEQQLAVGMKLYGRKNNEIWYKGTLVDIKNLERVANQRMYKIKYDTKGWKEIDGKGIAFHDSPSTVLPVGTRVIALYVDDELEERSSFYAGVVAESPSVRNTYRYLVFFDDGYAQYSTAKDVRKVFEQSRNVWEDIDPSSTSFIKNYLTQYPERPMVRLTPGQVIKTEWNGRWWIARVHEVDASLVKMYFDADQRVEWIYRGSTRLEPLYTELANAEASKNKGRRHHLGQKLAKKPWVEYTRQSQDEEQLGGRIQPRSTQPVVQPTAVDLPATKQGPSESGDASNRKRPVARKSTGGKVDGQPTTNRSLVASSVSRNTTGLDMASIIQNKLGQKDLEEMDDDALGERVGIERNVTDSVRKCFKPHQCSPACLMDIDDDPVKMKGNNPLLIPMLYGWERQIVKQRPYYRKSVFYRTPCARRLRSIEEVNTYLIITDSQLTVDLFCFDDKLHTDTEFVPIKTFCDIKDLSYGKENVPISCVNGIDRQYPDYVDYSIVRTPATGVPFKLDDDFLCGCDCTDNCMDKKNCACMQLTVQASAATRIAIPDHDVGYENRRLYGYVVTGIYECNSRCKCDRRCQNRVAQHGLQLRLQVFKTEKRGWGMRCLDDIPPGGFVCVYAGQLLSEQGANEDGQKYGDEYLAELDFIEVVERGKEGYESDVTDIEKEDNDYEEEEEEAGSHEPAATESDSSYSGEKPRTLARSKTKLSRSVKMKDLSPEKKVKEWVQNLPTKAPPAAGGEAILIISSDEEGDSNSAGTAARPGDGQPALPQVDGVHDSDDEKKNATSQKATSASASSAQADSAAGAKQESEEDSAGADAVAMEVDTGDDETPKEMPPMEIEITPDNSDKMEEELGSLQITEPTSLNIDNTKEDDEEPPTKVFQRTTRSKTKIEAIAAPQKQEDAENQEEKVRYPSLRTLFDDEDCYVMDAKSMGNLGRYLNHSCQPNIFVQNVFIDTHDLRFPWVAFFAAGYIRAGTELTWDYNYEIGSVPGKVLYCYCGAAECRGRLL